MFIWFMNNRFFSAFFLLLFLPGCGPTEAPDPAYKTQGAIFGTTYQVTWYMPGEEAARLEVEDRLARNSAQGMTIEQQVGQQVFSILDGVDAAMSHYREDSELTRFNRSEDTQWAEVSDAFYEVLRTASLVSEKSEGAFDVTISPLIELWGFGVADTGDQVPAREEIERILAETGMHHLEIDQGSPRIRKQQATLSVNLSAVAKGFAVDQVSDWLQDQGIRRFLVEVGGEIRAMGLKADGADWRVAIESPQGIREIYGVVPLRDMAIATSGDYRNYYEQDGVRYSHTLNPVTGRPITHTLASVSVLAASCALADSWATALMVLGPEAGKKKAESEQLAVFMIIREGEDFIPWASTAFRQQFGQIEVMQ